MTNQTYNIVFRGDIVMGVTMIDVKANLKTMFKVDDARVDSLFVGKPVALKRHLSKEEAERYQIILKRAGAIVSIDEVADKGDSRVPSDSTSAQVQVSGEENIQEKSGEWQLAPAGSQLSDKSYVDKTKVDKTKADKTQANPIQTDHLAVLPQEGNLVKDNERAPTPIADVDMDTLDWELTPYGESLLKETEKKQISPVSVDISGLSIAESGGDLLKPEEKKSTKPIEVNTDHIHLIKDDR